MASLWQKYTYYARSILTLFQKIDNPRHTLNLFLNRQPLPTTITLHNGWQFHIRSPMDAWVIKETCLDQDYLWQIDRFEPDWHIIDIGAGLGDFTIFAAKNAPQGIVHAYEPLAPSYQLLKKNLELNQINNVTTFPYATASQPGQLSLATTDGAAVSQQFTAANSGQQTATAVTLTQILAQLPNQHCHFLKLDCEGCEYDILLNATTTLQQIDRISLEFHNHTTPHTGQELVNHLQQHNFTVYTKENPVHDYLGFLFAIRQP
ncbi:MAG TPA: FkbM family methyltransferase [Anaerolineae bacterium]|nr:FkbM family methyltransferase [Anaerolineae bacterium]